MTPVGFVLDVDTTALAAALLLADDDEASPRSSAAASASATPDYGPFQARDAGSSTSPSSGDEGPPSASADTALPSSAWLQWGAGAPATLDIAAHLPEGALALRRQKNRESMRRARQRQRDQLRTLRDAVADLEREYAHLTTQAERSRSRASALADGPHSPAADGIRSPAADGIRSALADGPLDAASRAVEEARALTRRLGAENLLLRATLQGQQDWKLETRRVFETTGYLLGRGAKAAAAAFDAADSESGAKPLVRSPQPPRPQLPPPVRNPADIRSPPRLEVLSAFEAESVFGFRPLASPELKDLILDNARAVAGVQALLLGPAPAADVSPGSPAAASELEAGAASPPPVEPLRLEDEPNALRMEVFGWDVRQLVRGPEMLFSFSKVFPGTLDVAAVMQRAWRSELSLSGLQKVKYDSIALAPLQVLGSDAVVLGRDVRSPDEVPLFRSTLLRYRLETTRAVARTEVADGLADGSADGFAGADGSPLLGTGFVIGTQSLNPHKHAGAVLAPDLATLYRGRAEDGRADAAPVGSRLVWADLTYSIELLSVRDPRDTEDAPPRCALVRWAGKTNYGSPFDARRNTSDKLSTLLHWELQNIAPAVQFVYSADDE